MIHCEHARRATRSRPVGVLFVDVPPLLASLLAREIDASDDVHLVGPDAVDDHTPDSLDAVVLGVQNGVGAERVRALLMRWPWLRVLEIVVSGEAATLYELRPRRALLGELDPSEIIGALVEPGAYDWGRWAPEA